MFGGDGAYGEAKAAFDAFVTRWHAEKDWAQRVSLAHAHIGWVRGTGLMGGNDPLVDAVDAAGVRTWSPEEMAAELLALCTPGVARGRRRGARSSPTSPAGWATPSSTWRRSSERHSAGTPRPRRPRPRSATTRSSP